MSVSRAFDKAKKSIGVMITKTVVGWVGLPVPDDDHHTADQDCWWNEWGFTELDATTDPLD